MVLPSSLNRTQIAHDMFERYSGTDPKEVGQYVLLTNFQDYLRAFAELRGCIIKEGSLLKTATDKESGITLLQFNIGAPTAALVIDLLASIDVKIVLMLGLCGALEKNLSVGEFFLPLAAIRDEGVTRHYQPEQFPAIPSLKVQKEIQDLASNDNHVLRQGVVYSTDYRFWEFNEQFKAQFSKKKIAAIEMECSAIFVCSDKLGLSAGALLLCSDEPLERGGVKTQKSLKKVYAKYLESHLNLGIRVMERFCRDEV